MSFSIREPGGCRGSGQAKSPRHSRDIGSADPTPTPISRLQRLCCVVPQIVKEAPQHHSAGHMETTDPVKVNATVMEGPSQGAPPSSFPFEIRMSASAFRSTPW
jgi:hypothetical protein